MNIFVKLSYTILFLSILSCGKLDVIKIKDSSTTTIPGATIVDSIAQDSLSFGGFESLRFSQNTTLQNQGVKEKQVDSITVSKLNIEVVSPDGQDLGFINDLAFFINADGLEKIQIASSSDFEGKNSVDLELTGVEIKDYVTSDSMTITTEVSGDKPPQDTEIRGNIELRVDISIKGLFK